jgi:hypothetical protein
LISAIAGSNYENYSFIKGSDLTTSPLAIRRRPLVLTPEAKEHPSFRSATSASGCQLKSLMPEFMQGFINLPGEDQTRGLLRVRKSLSANSVPSLKGLSTSKKVRYSNNGRKIILDYPDSQDHHIFHSAL